MEISHLKYFIIAAECQSISKAAEKTGISQPAMSQTIMHIEREIGAKLFDRIGKRIYLNDKGKELLASARKIVDEVNDVSFRLANPYYETEKKVRLGVFVSQTVVIDALDAFCKQYPDIKIELNCSKETVDLMTDYPFDVMLYPNTRDYAKFKGVPVANESIGILINRDHPLAGRGKIDITELRDEPFVFNNTTSVIFAQSYAICKSGGFEPNIRFSTNDEISKRQIVSRGLAVGFATMDNRSEFTADSHLRFLELERFSTVNTIMLSCGRNASLSDSGKILRNFMLRHYGIPISEETLNRFEKSRSRGEMV